MLKQLMLLSFEQPKMCVQDFHDLENLAFLFTNHNFFVAAFDLLSMACLNFVLSKLALYIVFFFFWFSSYSGVKNVCTLLAPAIIV